MSAPTPLQYELLEPSFTNALGLKPPTFSGSSAAPLFASSLFIYNLLFAAILLGAVYSYTKAGLVRIPGTEAGIRLSKQIVSKTTFGLLGVFSLWIILLTVNKDLLFGDVKLTKFRTTSVGSSSAVPTSPGVKSVPIGGSDILGEGAIQNDPAQRSYFASNNITVNKPACKTPDETNCTTVGSMSQTTVQMLISLRAACPLPIKVEISGGVEAGHASHGPGKSPVDISYKDASLNACIARFPKSSLVPHLSSTGGELCYTGEVYENFGYVFCDEKSSDRHWHVYRPSSQ